MTTSAYFNTLVSSISGSESPLLLITIKHTSLAIPVRFVNDNVDLTSNTNVYTAASFNLALPAQPQDGLSGTSLVLPNTGDKIMSDFIESVAGQGLTVQIQVVLRSAPDDIEYDITLDALQFVVDKEKITTRLSAPNYFNQKWSAVLYGSKYSPALL